MFDKRHNGVIVRLSDNKECLCDNPVSKVALHTFCIYFSQQLCHFHGPCQTSETAQPPTSFEDDQQDYPEDQLSMNDESSIPAQPAPYSIDEDPPCGQSLSMTMVISNSIN